MFLKKVLRKTYVLMLKKKWNMKPSGAELCGGGVSSGLQDAYEEVGQSPQNP